MYYKAIGRCISSDNMHYNNVLVNFTIDWDAYKSQMSQDEPDVPLIIDKGSDRKVIKWVPTFMDCMSRTYGTRGPLSYVLRENTAVPAEVDDPLDQNSYYGQSVIYWMSWRYVFPILKQLIRMTTPHST